MSKKSDSVFSYFRAVGEEWERDKEEWEAQKLENELYAIELESLPLGGGWE